MSFVGGITLLIFATIGGTLADSWFNPVDQSSWYEQKPENCPSVNNETHVCSSLSSGNFICVKVACCAYFRDRNINAPEYNGEYDNNDDYDVSYLGDVGGCRLCYTSKYCTLYKCFDRCCDGYTRDIYGRCGNYSDGALQCENGGRPGWHGFFCECPKGFIGTACEIPICNCFNGGECMVRDGRPFCNCTEGHSGQQCELSTCRKCLNGGTCLRDHDREYCVCARGFVGESCENRFDQPATCPPYNGTDPACCGEECFSNSECAGDQVCCREGCKTVCRKPVSTCTARDGTRLMVGQNYKLNSCTECTCQRDGSLPCIVMDCAPPDCEPEFFDTLPGECCPTCLDAVRPPRIKCPSGLVILNTTSGNTEEFTIRNTGVYADSGNSTETYVAFSPSVINHCACHAPLANAVKVTATVRGRTDTAKCTFEAVLRDTIAPVFTSCPKDIYVMEYERPAWRDPVVSDNVGVARKQCPDPRNRQPLAPGIHPLSYKIWDFEENEGRCDFTIYVSSSDMPVEQLPQGQRERLYGSPRNDVFLIVGVTVGSLIFVAVVLVAVFLCTRRQRLNNQQNAAHARRQPRDLRTGFSHGIYAIPGDLDVKLPPYAPPTSPPPYEQPVYVKTGLLKEKDFMSQPPPCYTNPGYETLSSVRKESGGSDVSVKSGKTNQ